MFEISHKITDKHIVFSHTTMTSLLKVFRIRPILVLFDAEWSISLKNAEKSITITYGSRDNECWSVSACTDAPWL